MTIKAADAGSQDHGRHRARGIARCFLDMPPTGVGKAAGARAADRGAVDECPVAGLAPAAPVRNRSGAV